MNHRATGVLLALGFSFVASSSSAAPLPSLATFTAAAERASPDVREAESAALERAAEVDVAWGRLLPALTARGAYTRNQIEVAATIGPGGPITITPLDQLDATFTVDVPIVDVAAWSRISSARAASEAARARARVTILDVKKAVARSYYQLVGARALAAAADATIAATEANLAVVTQRRDAGRGSDLDVERAAAEVARAKQSAADARYLGAVAARALTSASGLAPVEIDAVDAERALTANLDEEAPLAAWEASTTSPLVDAAALERRAAEKDASAARAALLPTLSAFGQERLTNATGFSGRSSLWQAGVAVTWRFDVSTVATVRARDAARSTAGAREARAHVVARDRVHDDWQLVVSSLEKSRASRAQAKAADEARRQAKDRFAAGSATQLDVVQAERDAFAAAAARIQADAELAWARASLSLDSGRTR